MTKEFKDLKGVIAIATTPFNNENLIDFESVDRLSNYYIESKVSGVTILGCFVATALAGGMGLDCC